MQIIGLLYSHRSAHYNVVYLSIAISDATIKYPLDLGNRDASETTKFQTNICQNSGIVLFSVSSMSIQFLVPTW